MKYKVQKDIHPTNQRAITSLPDRKAEIYNSGKIPKGWTQVKHFT